VRKCVSNLNTVGVNTLSLRDTLSSKYMLHSSPVPRTVHFRIANPKLLVLTCSFVIALFLLAASAAHAQIPTEKPKGYVSDFAGVISAPARQRMEALSTELDQKAHAQLAIITVKSLEGRPVEDFTIDLATKWGIGTKAKKAGDSAADRGVLLFLAIEDRRSRIEVGYGLEPIIPDGRAGGILRSMSPYLRNGDYDSATLLGAGSIASIIAQDAGVSLTGALPILRQRSQDKGSPISPLKIIIILLFLLPFLLISRRGGRGGFLSGGPYIGGGGYGGGGWSGGGGGGGGFGGFGGGSFGGGGASGSW
jgi:uncharacterized protein